VRRLQQAGLLVLGALAAVCTSPLNAAAAATATVPEIDGAMVPAAIGLVTAGVLMIRARRGSK
jgi:hypothetical protein